MTQGVYREFISETKLVAKDQIDDAEAYLAIPETLLGQFSI